MHVWVNMNTDHPQGTIKLETACLRAICRAVKTFGSMEDFTHPQVRISPHQIQDDKVLIQCTVSLVIVHALVNLPRGFVWVCMDEHTHLLA